MSHGGFGGHSGHSGGHSGHSGGHSGFGHHQSPGHHSTFGHTSGHSTGHNSGGIVHLISNLLGLSHNTHAGGHGVMQGAHHGVVDSAVPALQAEKPQAERSGEIRQKISFKPSLLFCLLFGGFIAWLFVVYSLRHTPEFTAQSTAPVFPTLRYNHINDPFGKGPDKPAPIEQWRQANGFYANGNQAMNRTTDNTPSDAMALSASRQIFPEPRLLSARSMYGQYAENDHLGGRIKVVQLPANGRPSYGANNPDYSPYGQQPVPQTMPPDMLPKMESNLGALNASALNASPSVTSLADAYCRSQTNITPGPASASSFKRSSLEASRPPASYPSPYQAPYQTSYQSSYPYRNNNSTSLDYNGGALGQNDVATFSPDAQTQGIAHRLRPTVIYARR